MSLLKIDADDLAEQVAAPAFGTSPDTKLSLSKAELKALLVTAIKVVAAYDALVSAEDEWVTQWPKEPGDYLFCCRPKTREGAPRSQRTYLWSVEARRAGGSTTPHMLYSGGGMLLYEQEWEGVWRRFTVEKPDLDKLLSSPGDKR